jgi:hypothetical protein
MTDHPHHSKLHAEIEARYTNWRHLYRQGTAPPRQIRHTARQTVWALGDHLRCCHGARRLGLNPFIGDLLDKHTALHTASQPER